MKKDSFAAKLTRGTFQMSQKFDLIAIGRAAVDLNAVEYNRPLEETKSFAKFVGGSPANIAIGSAKLGQSRIHREGVR